MSLSIILIVVFAIIVLSSFAQIAKNKQRAIDQGAGAAFDVPAKDKVEKNKNVISLKTLKLMSYEEALEASKQFIYNITRAVLQKFTPDAQKEVMSIGRTLFNSGMQYMHVVDVMSLSIEKSRTMQVSTQKTEGVSR